MSSPASLKPRMPNMVQRWISKVTLTGLIKLSSVLTVVGVPLSLLGLFSPLFLDPATLQGAGSLASAVASIFGITIASAALFAYLKREEIGQTQSDAAFQQKLRLEQSLHQFMAAFQRITLMAAGRDLSQFGSEIKPFLEHLRKCTVEAGATDLYTALGSRSIQPCNGGKEVSGSAVLMTLSMVAEDMLKRDGATIDLEDHVLLGTVLDLSRALHGITKDNIYELIHMQLSSNPVEHMEDWIRLSARNPSAH